MKTARVAVYGLLVVATALVLALSWPNLVARVAYAVESGQASAAHERLAGARDLSVAFPDIVKSARPSVVSIQSERRVRAGRAQPNSNTPDDVSPGDTPEDLLNRMLRQRGIVPRDQVQRGLGSGVIIRADGYIVTNNHVVDGATDLRVALSDGRILTGKVIGTDDKTDLAVIKVDATDLHAAELGDSDALQVGEWVLAMGSPFGFTQSVTAGIISAKERGHIPGVDIDYQDFLQTDAAINPGNSGGPLLNLQGLVVGINTAIYSRSGGNQGIGFAIPATIVKHVASSLIDKGHVVRGWLGVAIQDLTPDLAHTFKFRGTEGALVGDVMADGPAEKAGLKSGDIITELDGKAITDSSQLRNAVASTAPGTEIKVTYSREGKQEHATLKVGELPTHLASAHGDTANASPNLGVTVEALKPDLADKLNLPDDLKGVVVTDVEQGSLAEESGLAVKDVILAVGDKPVATANEFNAALRKVNLKDGVRLRVRSGDMTRFVVIKEQ